MSEDKKNVYVTLHKNFVRTDIEYTDRATGETSTFNSVTLPKGTVIDGTDVGYYQFSPLFVNPSRFKGEDYRDIPLLANREVRLSKTLLDDQGKPVAGEDGKPVRDVVYAMPAQIKGALDEARKAATCRRRPRRATSAPWRSARATPGAAHRRFANEHAPFDTRNR